MHEPAPSRHRFITILLVMALVTGCLLWWMAREEVQEPDVIVSAERHSTVTKKESLTAPIGEEVEKPATTRQAMPAAESMIDAPSYPYQEETKVLSASGRVTTETMESLGLTEDEAETLRKITKKVMAEAAEDFTARTQELERTPGSTVTRYFTPAREDGGKAFLDALASGFEAAVGKDRSQAIMEGFKDFDYAGGLGRYEMELDVPPEGLVHYKASDPKGGRSIGGSASPERFRDIFGELVELPKPTIPEPTLPAR